MINAIRSENISRNGLALPPAGDDGILTRFILVNVYIPFFNQVEDLSALKLGGDLLIQSSSSRRIRGCLASNSQTVERRRGKLRFSGKFESLDFEQRVFRVIGKKGALSEP
jgi:hypothetical protein